MKKIISLAILALGLIIVSCSDDFLDKDPQGTLNPATLANADGVEALLISAYSLLDGWEGGWSTGGGAPWNAAASNWTYGDVYSDDAYKGTEAGDQPAMPAFCCSILGGGLDKEKPVVACSIAFLATSNFSKNVFTSIRKIIFIFVPNNNKLVGSATLKIAPLLTNLMLS